MNILVTSSSAQNEGFLFVHSGKAIAIEEKLLFSNQQAKYVVDERKLGDGINHITFFDAAGKPIAERLYFKRPVKQMNIVASINAGTFDVRKKVDVDLTVTGEQGTALSADLGISVYKIDSLQKYDKSDIVSYIWLKSELKGTIESPDFYLLNNTAESREALDNLMMTQGWRRFSWNDIMMRNSAKLSFLPEYNGHLIAGKVYDMDGKPASNKIVYAGMPGKRVQFYNALSDSTGNFLLNTKDFYGQNELVVQTNYELDSLYKISITPPFSEQYVKRPAYSFNISTSLAEQLKASSVATQVQNIYSSAKFKQFYYPGIDSTAFFGPVTKSYKLNEYVRFTTMEEVFREYVKEAFVSRRQKRFHIKIMTASALLEEDPLVLLDGVPYFNLDRVFAMDPLKIEKMNIINSRYYYGPSIFDGIISLQTTKGDLGGTEIDPHTVVLDYEGMQLQREFYSPVYESAMLVGNKMPDFRNLLYWSPNVTVSDIGKAKVSFYTSDLAGSYIGVLQGIGKGGVPG
ncbi:MAG: hypothetical protein EOO20_23530, partial [Chryseobacterium sp.]